MVTKAIIFCDRCSKEMKATPKLLGERYQPDFCPTCKKEFDKWMQLGKGGKS